MLCCAAPCLWGEREGKEDRDYFRHSLLARTSQCSALLTTRTHELHGWDSFSGGTAKVQAVKILIFIITTYLLARLHSTPSSSSSSVLIPRLDSQEPQELGGIREAEDLIIVISSCMHRDRGASWNRMCAMLSGYYSGTTRHTTPERKKKETWHVRQCSTPVPYGGSWAAIWDVLATASRLVGLWPHRRRCRHRRKRKIPRSSTISQLMAVLFLFQQ